MANRFGDAIDQKTADDPSPAAEEVEKAASGDDDIEHTRLNVRVPTPLYEAFKEKVESEGRTITWVILKAIRSYLDKSV